MEQIKKRLPTKVTEYIDATKHLAEVDGYMSIDSIARAYLDALEHIGAINDKEYGIIAKYIGII